MIPFLRLHLFGGLKEGSPSNLLAFSGESHHIPALPPTSQVTLGKVLQLRASASSPVKWGSLRSLFITRLDSDSDWTDLSAAPAHSEVPPGLDLKMCLSLPHQERKGNCPSLTP